MSANVDGNLSRQQGPIDNDAVIHVALVAESQR